MAKPASDHYRLRSAPTAFARFVADGYQQESSWHALRGQIFLGSGSFVEKVQQRRPPARALSYYAA